VGQTYQYVGLPPHHGVPSASEREAPLTLVALPLPMRQTFGWKLPVTSKSKLRARLAPPASVILLRLLSGSSKIPGSRSPFASAIVLVATRLSSSRTRNQKILIGTKSSFLITALLTINSVVVGRDSRFRAGNKPFRWKRYLRTVSLAFDFVRPCQENCRTRPKRSCARESRRRGPQGR